MPSFLPRASKPLLLELGLLAVPALAVLLMVSLIPARGTGQAIPEKVNLRVTSANPPPDLDLAREQRLRRDHIRFALTKVTDAQKAMLVIAASTVAMPVFDGAVKPAATVTKPVATVTETESGVAAAGMTHSTRPRTARRAAPRLETRSGPRRLDERQPAHLAEPPAKVGNGRDRGPSEWLSAAWEWPAAAASATIAPVRRTLVRTVDEAGTALKIMKQKIL